MGNVGCNVRVLYLRSENNLRRLELLSHLTVHIGAAFFSVKKFRFDIGVQVIDCQPVLITIGFS